MGVNPTDSTAVGTPKPLQGKQFLGGSEGAQVKNTPNSIYDINEDKTISTNEQLDGFNAQSSFSAALESAHKMTELMDKLKSYFDSINVGKTKEDIAVADKTVIDNFAKADKFVQKEIEANEISNSSDKENIPNKTKNVE